MIMKKTTYQNLQDEAAAVVKGKFKVLNAYDREGTQICDFSFNLQKLEKEQRIAEISRSEKKNRY